MVVQIQVMILIQVMLPIQVMIPIQAMTPTQVMVPILVMIPIQVIRRGELPLHHPHLNLLPPFGSDCHCYCISRLAPTRGMSESMS